MIFNLPREKLVSVLNAPNNQVEFKHYHTEDGIVVFEFNGTSPLILEQWYHIALAFDLIAVKKRQHIRSLYIVRRLTFNASLVPAIRRAYANTPKDLIESIALTTPNMRFLRFLNQETRETEERAKSNTRLFIEEFSAMAWLRQRTTQIERELGVQPFIHMV